jgi:large subunit ribosomal protein L9
MKVILKDNIENLGKRGDIVNVASGYGRNYLVPKKMALEVTATNFKMIEMVQVSLRKGLEKEMKVYQSVIEKLNAVTLTFTRKAGEKDAIFGSVNVTDIRDALAGLDFEIEKKKILLDEPIKQLGNYTVPIKVFHDDKALIRLEVKKEGGYEDIETPKPVETVILAAEPEAAPEPSPEPAVQPEAVVEEKPEEPEAPPAKAEEPEVAPAQTDEPVEPEADALEFEEAPEVPTDPVSQEFPSEKKPDPEAKT